MVFPKIPLLSSQSVFVGPSGVAPDLVASHKLRRAWKIGLTIGILVLSWIFFPSHDGIHS